MFRQLIAGVTLVVMAAACSDSTGPENFSATKTEQVAAAVVGALGNNTALQTLDILGASLSLSGPALAAAPFAAAEMGGDVNTTARLQTLGQAVLNFGAASPLAIFPANLLGKTYVYNPQTSQFEIDDARTGAPAAGVRFILYAVDPIARQIVTPLNEVGYLDLIDVSTPSADAVQIVAVIGTITYIDYTASATTNTNSASLNATGFVSDGTDQIDFNLTLTVSQTAITADYTLSSGAASVRLQVNLTQAGLTFVLTVTDGNETVAMTVNLDETTVDGSIRYNGDVVVVITGDPDNPQFTRPDGTPLTQEEALALRALGDFFDEIFDAFDNLLIPAFVVFAIG